MIGKLEVSGLVDKLKDNPNVSLYLFENRGTQKNPYSLYKLSIDKGISDKLVDIASKSAERSVQLLKEERLKDFPVYNPDVDRKVFKISSEGVDVFEDIFPKIVEEKAPEQFSMNKVKEDKLKGWIVRIELEIDGAAQQIVFFQKFQKSKMLAKKKLFIFEANDGFKLFEKKLLVINEEFDSFYLFETIFVLNMFAFEKMFSYEKFYKKKAKILIDRIGPEARKAEAPVAFRIVDKKIIKAKIEESNRIARQIYKAKVSGYYKCIHYEELKSIDTNYGIGLKLDDEKKMWTIDKGTNLYAAGKILNDDFQKSLLTEIEYLSMGKEKNIKAALNIRSKRVKGP